MDRYKEYIKEIAQEITDNYTLSKYNKLILENNTTRDCLVLTPEAFYYSSDKVKALYNKIKNDCKLMETFKGQLDNYCMNLLNKVQTEILSQLKIYYCMKQEV